MGELVLRSPGMDPVKQFSVFVENKVGRILEVVGALADYNVHTLALTVIDTADCSILKMVVDDPDKARMVFGERRIRYVETNVLVVEIPTTTGLPAMLKILLQAEVIIHHIYALIPQHQGKSALVLYLEDAEIGAQALTQSGFKVLCQRDVSR